MNIHEYQAKELLHSYNIPYPRGMLITSTDMIDEAYDKLGANKVVIKAQIHAGARGKGGGIIVSNNPKEIVDCVDRLLKNKLITPQTSKDGLMVNSVLIEEAQDITCEMYLSFLIDRDSKNIVIITSKHGGMDIEQMVADKPDSVIKTYINPCLGLLDYQKRELAFSLGLSGQIWQDFLLLLTNSYSLFIANDLSLLEINPLVITDNNKLMALDTKINCEDNALYRQPSLAKLRDISQEQHYESMARQCKLSYIALNGNIGCMVNGAGLAMATMDLISHYGGSPANFLDVGGGVTKELVTKAMEIITNSSQLDAIFINIFGGIVHCDLIAHGILDVITTLDNNIAIVARLIGTNSKEAQDILNNSTAKIYCESDLILATKKVIELAN